MAVVVLAWDGRAVRFTDERRDHIVKRHRTLIDERDRLIETIHVPDLVQRSDGGEALAIRRHDHAPFNGNDLVVAHIEEGARGGFIVTAYPSRRLTTRRTMWTR